MRSLPLLVWFNLVCLFHNTVSHEIHVYNQYFVQEVFKINKLVNISIQFLVLYLLFMVILILNLSHD